MVDCRCGPLCPMEYWATPSLSYKGCLKQHGSQLSLQDTQLQIKSHLHWRSAPFLCKINCPQRGPDPHLRPGLLTTLARLALRGL